MLRPREFGDFWMTQTLCQYSQQCSLFLGIDLYGLNSHVLVSNLQASPLQSSGYLNPS